MSEDDARAEQRGIALFTIAGIQIRLDYSWSVVFLLILWSLSAGYFPQSYPGQSGLVYWAAGLIAAVFFFTSILIHEISHSLTARRFGIEIRDITLFIFGGRANISREPESPKTELIIAAVGPLASFVLAGLFWLVASAFSGVLYPIIVIVLEYLVWINIALGIFNLFPGFPLDGGRIFRALWWWKTGSLHRATKVAAAVGQGFALILIVLGALQIFSGVLVGGLWLIFIGMFLRSLAASSYRELVLRQSLDAVQAREIMVHDVVTVPPSVPIRTAISDYFLRYGFRGFPVMRNGEVLGIISLAELKNLPEAERDRNAEDLMMPKSEMMEIDPEASLTEALNKMTRNDIGRLLQ